MHACTRWLPTLETKKWTAAISQPVGCHLPHPLLPLAGYIPKWFTCPKTISNPSTNRDRCWLTSLIRPTSLATTSRCQTVALQRCIIYSNGVYCTSVFKILTNRKMLTQDQFALPFDFVIWTVFKQRCQLTVCHNNSITIAITIITAAQLEGQNSAAQCQHMALHIGDFNLSWAKE